MERKSFAGFDSFCLTNKTLLSERIKDICISVRKLFQVSQSLTINLFSCTMDQFKAVENANAL